MLWPFKKKNFDPDSSIFSEQTWFLTWFDRFFIFQVLGITWTGQLAGSRFDQSDRHVRSKFKNNVKTITIIPHKKSLKHQFFPSDLVLFDSHLMWILYCQLNILYISFLQNNFPTS